MFRKQSPESTSVEVEGLTCYVPPEGYVYDPYSQSLVFIGVEGEDRRIDLQYWRRPTLPKDYYGRVEEMNKQRRYNSSFVDPVVTAVRKREWLRRLGGYWFMNRGQPTYITGVHYFYLTYYRLDIGYPAFRKMDQRVFYMWDYICGDPHSMGLMLISRRRYGKTFIGGCILLDYATRHMRASCGIQSKDEMSAEKAFKEAVSIPFKYLPDFFAPKSNTRKVRELTFSDLNSTIDYRAVGEVAYDGYKLHRYLCDEFGKTIGADIMKRHNVVKYCLMDVPKIIGKAFYCTTVEEMESGNNVKLVEDMWNGSDHIDGRGQDGRTYTGLYRIMIPAYKSMKFDRYGYVNEKSNMRYIMSERRKALEAGDQERYLEVVRKMPNTFREAILSTTTDSAFSNLMVNLAEQRELLKAGLERERTVRGYLKWTEERDCPVVFAPNSGGPWQMLREYADKSLAKRVRFVPNKVFRGEGYMMPENAKVFGMGVDPYSKSKTVDKRQSKGAIAVFRMFDPLMVDDSDMFVATYLKRPRTVTAFYEEVLKACWYFGCQFLHEDNVSGVEEYARSRGYANFVYRIPGRRTGGISSNVHTKSRMVSFMEGYIEECIDKVFFVNIVEDLMSYDIKKSHDYDMAAASMIALMMCHRSRSEGIGIWGTYNKNSDLPSAIDNMIDLSVFR